MSSVLEQINQLFTKTFAGELATIEKLPPSGSDRQYFRIHAKGKNYIATYNDNVRENATFINFSRQFKSVFAPVPEIFAVNDDSNIYLQQDFGDVSLLNTLEKEGPNENVFTLYQKSLFALANLQINADNILNYEDCITSKEFGKPAILADLLYFKYYFLDTLKIAYDKEKLINDFEALATYLAYVDHKYFMFRDFQGRNIMVKNNEVFSLIIRGG